MKTIDLTIPFGVGTPPWPTYEPLQLKYFKRLAPNGANGQLLTHSNHVGTHLDGEIHFHTPGKDIASLEMDYLVNEGAIVDLSDIAGDYMSQIAGGCFSFRSGLNGLGTAFAFSIDGSICVEQISAFSAGN